MTDDLVTVKRAARLLHRSEDTIRRWLDEGKLSGIDYGPWSPKLVSLASVRRLLAAAAIAARGNGDPTLF
jgi:hypothetical protein